jgi:hypothetical protein
VADSMNSLDRTLVLKKPAVIVRTQRPAQYLTGGPRDRHVLMARAIQLQRRGHLEIEWEAPRWDQQYGQYLLKVRRLREPAPAWRAPVLAGAAALLVLAGLFALAWYALSALTTRAGALFLAAVLVVFACWVARRTRSSSVTVTTTTTVTVRR